MNSSHCPNQIRAAFVLRTFVEELLDKDIELVRPCRTGCLLVLSGLSANSLPKRLMLRVEAEQHSDGGWVGPDDTMWCLLLMRLCGRSNSKAFEAGLAFLHASHIHRFGWGRSERDIPRIPVTGRVLHLLPEVFRQEYLSGLLELWGKEIFSLTYKAAFTLSASVASGELVSDNEILRDTHAWLVEQQNSDGGFAPWHGHPAGSDVYCTAIALIGLMQIPPVTGIAEEAIRRGLTWMGEHQLGTGLWPYHQIEDGSAWGLYSIVTASKWLSKLQVK